MNECMICQQRTDPVDSRQASRDGSRAHYACEKNARALFENTGALRTRAKAVVECWDAGCTGCQDRRSYLRAALDLRVHDGPIDDGRHV